MFVSRFHEFCSCFYRFGKWDQIAGPFDEIDMDGDGLVQCENFNLSTYRQGGGSFSIIGGEDCNDDPYNGGSEIGAPFYWYIDNDGDLDGDLYSTTPLYDCEQPDGHVLSNTDCNDEDVTIFPDADEVCDGKDNDCDNEIDEGSVEGLTTFYIDNDNDGMGSVEETTQSCYIEEGYSWNDLDPDDENSDTSFLIEDLLGIDMVRIPAGSFRMGSNITERFRTIYEVPRHVTLQNSFYMSAWRNYPRAIRSTHGYKSILLFRCRKSIQSIFLG